MDNIHRENLNNSSISRINSKLNKRHLADPENVSYIIAICKIIFELAVESAKH